MDIRNRYSRSWLGLGWSLLHPISMTAILCLVFRNLFAMNVAEYAPSLLAGLCFWTFLTSSTVGGCTCLIRAEQYIRQYSAPIAIYPLRTVLGAGFHFLIAILVVLALRFWFKGFDNLPILLTLVPSFVLIFLFAWSLAIIMSIANTYFPDTQHLAEVGLQMLFYATPIIYPPAMLRDRGLGFVVDLNPLASFIDLIRAPVMSGAAPSAQTLGLVLLATLLTSSLALFTLGRFQRTIVFQL
jgi:ABC-type polysaccharide/polyol phosphate export permease